MYLIVVGSFVEAESGVSCCCYCMVILMAGRKDVGAGGISSLSMATGKLSTDKPKLQCKGSSNGDVWGVAPG